jgi:two-component system, NarL family, sensor histidine kinase UhpB
MVNSKFRSQLLETRLEARDSQLELAAEARELGFWTLEPTTGDLAWSRRCQSLLGVAADSAATFEALIAGIHPDDQQRVRRAFSQALQFKREFSVEFRIAADSPSVRRLRCTGRPHGSAVNRQQPALSGLLQAIEEAPAVPALGSRVGSIVYRMESLRELERATLISRMKSEVSQSLMVMRQRAQALAEQAGTSPLLLQELHALVAEADAGLEAVRCAIFEMRPPGVEELGFAGALERYASEQAAAAGIALSLALPDATIPVGAPTLEALYVVARTGIDNVVRHARARNMQVSVQFDQNELALRIVDDGVGIAEADLMKDCAFSLFASSERLANSGGELRVSGKPGQGTTLEATIALRDKIKPLRHNVTPLRVA